MPASTDARVLDLDKQKNLVSRGGKNKNYTTTVNGKTSFVDIRLGEEGDIQLLTVEREGNIERPYILASLKEGEWNFDGGSGRIYDRSFESVIGSDANNLLQSTGKIVSNDRATAIAILNNAKLNGEPISITDQLKFASETAQEMYKVRKSNIQRIPGANPNAFLPSTTEKIALPVVQAPYNPNEEIQVVPGSTSAENNDPNAPNPNAEGNESGDAGTIIETNENDKLKNLAAGLAQTIGNILEDMKITPEEIQKFETLFESGGGDQIQSAAYPTDNTYGEIRGQDFVTIDQFIYLPPRRDQILGTDSSGDRINPLETITNGQFRLSPLKEFVAQVKLPMPNNITDSNNVAWGDDAMNNLSAALTASVMRNPVAGLIGGAVSSLNGPLGQMITLGMVGLDNDGIVGPDGVTQRNDLMARIIAAAKSLDAEGVQTLMKTNTGAATLGMLGVNVSPESILSRGFGVIPNSNLELLFNNVTLRDFQFSWRMSPRDKNEAKEVKKIIRFFKQGMAAKTMNNQAGDRSIYLGTPNVFRMQFRTTGGRIIEGVNRIKPCAVVGTAVNYTPDGQWSAYDEGQPVSCTFSIQMKELEPVYASDYSEKVIGSRRSEDRIFETFEQTETVFDGGDVSSTTSTFDLAAGDGDLYPIRPNEVGY